MLSKAVAKLEANSDTYDEFTENQIHISEMGDNFRSAVDSNNLFWNDFSVQSNSFTGLNNNERKFKLEKNAYTKIFFEDVTDTNGSYYVDGNFMGNLIVPEYPAPLLSLLQTSSVMPIVITNITEAFTNIEDAYTEYANLSLAETIEPELMPLTTRIVFSICLSLILLIGLAGNLLVIAVVWKDRELSLSSTGAFIVNLAIADLLVLSICLPTTIAELHAPPLLWVLPATLCEYNR